jgi:phosphopantothenoylcysteine decarboxylase/phosphopantothenate--cysteine ligase
MRLLITCGPSFEPVDQVRRLTNFSTGELGVTLAEAFSAKGASVLCLKGQAATFRNPAPPVETHSFTTNENLYSQLTTLSQTPPFDALLHVAALSDYHVDSVHDESGTPRKDGKVPSNLGKLVLHLAPAKKLISELTRLFPSTTIVGWKYEVDGTVADAVLKGFTQIQQHHTHACVVNGPACGRHLILCRPPETQTCLNNRQELVDLLLNWLLPNPPPRR